MTYILVSDGFSPFLGDDDNETSANITALEKKKKL